MEPVIPDIDFEKLAAEMSGNTLIDENQVNDQAYQQIVGFLKTDKMNQFRGLATSEERIKFIYKNEAYWPLIQAIRRGAPGGSLAGKGEKDGVMSKQMRDAGNSAFTAQDDELALKCYNEALLAAPADPWDGQGEDMALALANRSALYKRQDKIEECLKDTNLALKCGYPKHLKYKVYQRQAECLCDLGNFKEAKFNFREALNFLNVSKINRDQKNNVENKIQSQIDAIQIKDDLETALKEAIPDTKSIIVTSKADVIPNFLRNPKFPSLHKSVTIKYDSKRGRHAVATDDIKCGTYILYEEPTISFLWSEQLLTHCTYCFTPVASLIPCFTCCLVVFCSADCRTKAWNSFHQYECKALEAMTSMYQNIFVAYRAIAQKPLRYFLENQSKFTKYDHHRAAGCYEYEFESDSDDSGETEPDSEDETHEIDCAYRPIDYDNLYNLLTHSRKASEADHLAFSTSACLLLYYLKISNYFGSSASRESDRELNDSEILIGRLLYHILEVNQYNTQEVCQAVAWNQEKGITTASIGCAVNPTIALFNHSCAPNTIRANIGPNTIMVTTENIKKGQELNDSYSYQFHDKLIGTRKKWLKERYKFDCKCEACENKWPMYEFMTKSIAKPGVNAKALHHIKKMYSTISKLTITDFSVGHYDRIHTMWANYFNELNMTLEKPNKGFVRLSSRLQDVLWLRWGSRGAACKAPPYRDHRINQVRSSSNINIPQLMGEKNEADQKEQNGDK